MTLIMYDMDIRKVSTFIVYNGPLVCRLRSITQMHIYIMRCFVGLSGDYLAFSEEQKKKNVSTPLVKWFGAFLSSQVANVL